MPRLASMDLRAARRRKYRATLILQDLLMIRDALTRLVDFLMGAEPAVRPTTAPAPTARATTVAPKRRKLKAKPKGRRVSRGSIRLNPGEPILDQARRAYE